MVISIRDWQFDVDISANMEISAAQAAEHCMCGYCRNFYQGIDDACPSLRPFLAEFGVHVEGPDELSPFEPTIYEASYIVQGSILSVGTNCFRVDDIPICVVSSGEADMDTVRPEPYFVLTVGLIELPWLLDEDPSQVISPANEEYYLQRMEKKLLKRLQMDNMYS